MLSGNRISVLISHRDKINRSRETMKRQIEESNGPIKKKRPVACLRCRKQKLKCIFAPENSGSCLRCTAQNKACVIGSKPDETDWRDSTNRRLDNVEKSIGKILELLEKNQNTKLGSTGSNGSPSGGVSEKSFYLDNLEGTVTQRPQKSLNEAEVREILEFFNNNLAKYLPIFIFDYIPPITRQIESVSTVLFSAILSVTTLYLPSYNNYHGELISRFKEIVEQLSPANIFDSRGKPHNIMNVIHDMLGCIVAAAWLGNDIGARCCIIASDLAGRLNPQILDELEIDEISKRAAFAFSLTSYIIEKRLLISYTKSEVVNMNNEMSANRDYFLPLYLSQMFVQGRGDRPDSTEYKVNANVELCALTSQFQKELAEKKEDIYDEIVTNWTEKLNNWLAVWIGKLTTHLDSSSIKPLILAFNFAKLFVNVQAINSIGSKTPNVIAVLTRSENTSLDIIEMLLLDNDMRRLVRMGPIFYPTIFVTAAASLLKIVTMAPRYQYNTNRRHLVEYSKKAYEALSTCIVSPAMPCHASISTLGDGIKKVTEKLSATPQTANLNYPEQMDTFLSNELLHSFATSTSYPEQNKAEPVTAPNIPLADYREIWAMDLFGDENFSWDGFNADLMRSIHESPQNISRQS